MPRDPRAWLLDILVACDLLADFTRGKSFGDYAPGGLLCCAPFERQLEIIGEAFRVAVQHRPVLATQMADVPPAIIAFRSQLTHACSVIDRRTVETRGSISGALAGVEVN
jgi:uncharacterized protein with HEPN domain